MFYQAHIYVLSCKMEEEISHLFYYRTHVKDIWNQVQAYLTH